MKKFTDFLFYTRRGELVQVWAVLVMVITAEANLRVGVELDYLSVIILLWMLIGLNARIQERPSLLDMFICRAYGNLMIALMLGGIVFALLMQAEENQLLAYCGGFVTTIFWFGVLFGIRVYDERKTERQRSMLDALHEKEDERAVAHRLRALCAEPQ